MLRTSDLRRARLQLLRSPEAAQRFPPHPGHGPMAQGCYNFSMVSEIDSLQARVDAIRATGDSALAGRAWHALSKVLCQFTRDKTDRAGPNVPIIRRVNLTDVEFLLADLADR